MRDQLTIEEIGRISREYRPSQEELLNRQASLAAGLRPHDSKMTNEEATQGIKRGVGTLLAVPSVLFTD